jgi:hypothetical protein
MGGLHVLTAHRMPNPRANRPLDGWRWGPIGARFPLSETAAALRHVADRRALGKVLIVMTEQKLNGPSIPDGAFR